MQAINGNMTQYDFDVICNRITELELLQFVNGEDHSEELKKLKEQIDYKEDVEDE